jgi:MFS family permease
MEQRFNWFDTGSFSSKHPAAYPVIVLILAFTGNLFAGLISTIMATYLPEVVHDMLLSSDLSVVSYTGSYIGSLYLLGWALGGISLGWLGDRFGRARLFTTAVLIMALFTLSTSYVNHWYQVVAFRFLAGIGAGAVMVMSAVIVAEEWGKFVRGRAIAISIVAVGFPIGIIMSGVVSYFISDWRPAFLIGLIPLLLSILCYLFLREPSQWYGEEPEEHGTPAGENEFFKLLNPENRTNFIVAATIFGAMLVGIWATFSWLPTWVQSIVISENGGQQERGLVMMLLGTGGIAGSIIGGFLANGIGRKGALLIAFSGAFLASSILFWTNNIFTSIIYFQTAFLALFFGISQGILTAYIPELFPARVRSTATGICFNAGRVVTAFGVFFVGILVPLLGGYGNALWIFSFTYVIGFVSVLYGEETKGIIL